MLENRKSWINKSQLIKIYQLVIPYKGIFFIALIATILMSVLNPLRAHLTEIAIDDYMTNKDGNGLVQIIILMLFLLIFQSIIQFAQGYLTSQLGQNIIKDLRSSTFKFITRYRLSKLDQTPIGTLVTRTIGDLETLAEVFSEGAVAILGDLLQIIFILILMFIKDWKLTLLCLTVLPFLGYAGYLFKNAVNISFNNTRNQITKLNTFVQEHIQGMHIVQIFGQEKKEYNKFDTINQGHRDAQNKGVFAYAVFFPVVEIITAFSIAIIVWYGLKIDNRFTSHSSLGMLTGFIMLINQFFRPIRQLADRFNTLQMGMIAGDRVFKLLEEENVSEIINIENPYEIQGHIIYKNVAFSYNNGPNILTNINFEIQPGKTLALVGATGSGKSTIISLLNKFYTEYTGDILIDNKSLNSYNIIQLRKQIGLVMQDVYLFSGSIYDNLTLYDSSVPFEKVTNACKMAGIHDFINQLPNGYQEYVHERGSTLSTGQRQLIAFVRAMIADPAILILDEATSSVDNYAESLIQNSIEILMKNRTSIVIAHRLTTIKKVDEILVIDKGQIIERGRHDELITLNGTYSKLYQMQFIK